MTRPRFTPGFPPRSLSTTEHHPRTDSALAVPPNLQRSARAPRATGGWARARAGAALNGHPRLKTRRTVLEPRFGAPSRDVDGRYRCAELDAELTVTDAGGALYGGFSGFLGQG